MHSPHFGWKGSARVGARGFEQSSQHSVAGEGEGEGWAGGLVLRPYLVPLLLPGLQGIFSIVKMPKLKGFDVQLEDGSGKRQSAHE